MRLGSKIPKNFDLNMTREDKMPEKRPELMRKRRSVSVKIAFRIGILEAIAMTLLFVIINMIMTVILQDKAIRDMNVIARDRAELVETYIRGCCHLLDGYSKATEIREVLLDPTNAEKVQKARSCTNTYAKDVDSLEGLYVAGWDTYVLAHNNPDSVDKTFRDKEGAAQLEKMIREKGATFCTGIVLAPVTKQMVIPIYAPVRSESGEMIGFAGAAFHTDALSRLLNSLSDGSEESFEYSLLMADSGTYIFDNDASLVGQKVSHPELLNGISALTDPRNDYAYYSTSADGQIYTCYYMADRGWVFVIMDSEENVFRVIKNVRIGLAVACTLLTILMILTCFFSVRRQMEPLKSINEAIIRMKWNDYSKKGDMERCIQREDEFGIVAGAVKELHDVLQNQDELFREVMKIQTAGALVTKADTMEVLLVNDMALSLFGFPPEDASRFTVEKLLERTEEAERPHIHEIMQNVRDGNGSVSFEQTVHPAKGQRLHLLVNAKGVLLSDGERVIVHSMMDITERKELEENLLVLSETDALTGLLNRRSGEKRIKSAVEKGFQGMFCLFDVNKFKTINDSFGHATGDLVLKGIGNTMQTIFRSSDICIRLGGDEFVVFALKVSTREVGEQVLDRFLKGLEKFRPEELKGHPVTVSLGAVLVTEAMDFSEMYSKADSLMYECKKTGGNAYRFYQEE